jgi:hypothetical protein
LTILQEPNGYLGGYLVTNLWGRPLEFRLSSAVQPNRVQQVLYGATLLPYICADLIGKTLVEKTGVPAQFVFTDREAALDLRLKLDVPVLWLAPPDDALAASMANSVACVRPAVNDEGPVLCHPRFSQDTTAAREMLKRLDGNMELTEPFARIREAMSEARKLGVTSRA